MLKKAGSRLRVIRYKPITADKVRNNCGMSPLI